MTISFFVPGKPAPGGSKRVFPIRKKGVPTGKFIVTDAAGQANKDWRASVAYAAFEAMKRNGRRPVEEAIQLSLTFKLLRPKNHHLYGGVVKNSAPLFPTKRPDLGKYARSTTDALTGIVFRDDSQIVVEKHSKIYSETPGCMIEISSLP